MRPPLGPGTETSRRAPGTDSHGCHELTVRNARVNTCSGGFERRRPRCALVAPPAHPGRSPERSQGLRGCPIRAVMANVVSEGATGRRKRTLRAEVALRSLSDGPDSPQRLRRVLEQALVFAGATFAAVYAPGEDGGQLGLVESAGVPRTMYGLRDSYP